MRLCLTAAYRDFSKRFDPIYHAARLIAKHVKARIRGAFDHSGRAPGAIAQFP
jgi:hypothetical protein